MTVKLHADAWKPLRYHPVQHEFFRSEARFIVAAAGRRSGKSAIAKRKGVLRGMRFRATADGKVVFAAPTRDQAKRLFWRDLLRLVPGPLVGEVSHSELSIEIVTGLRFQVVGMDRPQRIEGDPLDGIVLDELDETKAEAWTSSIRPALSTPGRPPGWAILLGRPKGRKNLWELRKQALASEVAGEWAYFHWKSREIIDPDEDAAARRTLDARTYAQEYDADFVNFEGRIYYPFDAGLHAQERLPYFPDEPLYLTFDFNRSPGTAAVHQEQRYWGRNPRVAPEITATIGEVWIPNDSNTRIVCERILQDWGTHRGHVYVYGDATGGAKTTQAIAGTNWDIIEAMLRARFGERLHMRIAKRNPPVIVRVNAVNSRLMTVDGIVHWLLDPVKAPHVVEDFEGVVALQGGADGEMDKEKFPMLTHLTDGAGYMIEIRHPILVEGISSIEI